MSWAHLYVLNFEALKKIYIYLGENFITGVVKNFFFGVLQGWDQIGCIE